MNLNKNKVAVGMSGGVDSTVTAYLLKEKGYEVIGLTMLLFDEYDENGHIVEPQHVSEARRIANILEIPHYVVDYREIFNKSVKKEFEEEYLKGKTPNPCVTCNRIIKYGKMIESAHDLGAYYLATGHYANIVYDNKIGRYRIYKGIADRKDQAYVLHSLSQEQLKYIILPLGKFCSKQKIREIAYSIDTNIAKKPDSMGVCFIPNGDYRDYFASRFPKSREEGNFVDIQGNVIGKHRGIVNYTIGQKRGLSKHFKKPMVVIDICAEKNEVILGNDELTYSMGLIARNPNFTLFDELVKEIKAEVKICQWGLLLSATIIPLEDGKLKVLFDKKERAVAPGQAVVFYSGSEIIGGGTIESVIK